MTFKDALEVYYLAVIMGFRGFYDDPDPESLAHDLDLPRSLEEWCANTALSLQLKQGRPKFDDAGRIGGTARPLSGRQSLINMSMTSVLLVAVAIGFFWIFGPKIFPSSDNANATVSAPK